MPAFAAFAEYRDLGSERSLEQVRQKVGKSLALMERWSTKWKWVSRAQQFDAHIDSIKLVAREQSSIKQASKIMSADEVKQGLTKIAEADIAEIFEPDGSFDIKSAQKRGVSKLIKTLNFDKDTGKVIKVEMYSAHEGHRDMGKTHAIFVDKSEIEDKTPLSVDTLTAIKSLAKRFSGRELTDDEAKQALSESFARIDRASDKVQ